MTISTSILCITDSLLYLLCLLLIHNKIFSCKTKKAFFVVVPSIYVILFAIAIVIPEQLFIRFCLLIPIIGIILLKICLSSSRIFTLIGTYAFLFALNAILSSTLISFFNLSVKRTEGFILLLQVIVCVIVCVVIPLRNRAKNVLQWTPTYIKALIILLLLFSVFVISLILDIQNNATNVQWLFLTHIFLVLLVLSVCAILPILVTNAVSNTFLKRLTDNYQSQIQIQAEHYANLAKSNFELRQFRHDFKNLWIGLNELIAKGETQEALNMLNKCHGSFVNSTDSILDFDTGNGIVDALLSDKQETAKTHNAVIQFSGAVPSQGISPTDLCVLFGNTLDNALEACEKLPADSPKTIRIICKRTGAFLFISISNPVIENVEIKNNSIPTTKEDKTLHGFGLYSLEQIVKKHDGALSLTCLDNLFEVSIDLCIDL